MTYLRLEGKVALVTGASRGIGRAIASAYAQEGANLICTARSEDKLNETVETIRELGGSAFAVKADITAAKEVQKLFEFTAERFGGLDILVVNAGMSSGYQSVESGDPEVWRQTIETNLFGAYSCIKEAIPLLKARGAGKIITLGSGLGHNGRPGGSAYACSKAALWMLTQVVAQELTEHNISVNELVPGPVETGMLSDEFRKNVVEKEHEWLKTPEEVCELALFLATQPDNGPSAQSFSLMRRAR
ncbi:MAG: SDR family oxidoreductase [Trueperaceae bacterium]|nr:SDR family oxidoreductase [Trueperaceae bacterium]